MEENLEEKLKLYENFLDQEVKKINKNIELIETEIKGPASFLTDTNKTKYMVLGNLKTEKEVFLSVQERLYQLIPELKNYK